MSWLEMLEECTVRVLRVTVRLKRTGVCHGVKIQYCQNLQCQCLLSHIVKLATNKGDRNEWFREKKVKLCQIL
jgi:hypothetical protein